MDGDRGPASVSSGPDSVLKNTLTVSGIATCHIAPLQSVNA